MNTLHHVIPTSRKGRDGKVIKLPKTFHSALHILAGNLYGEEIVAFVKELNVLMEERGELTNAQLEHLRNDVKRQKLNKEEHPTRRHYYDRKTLLVQEL